MTKLKKFAFCAWIATVAALARAEPPPTQASAMTGAASLFTAAAAEAERLSQGAAPATLEAAEKLFQSGDWEKARQAYRNALSSAADATALPASFFYNYGTVLARAGAPGEAYVFLLRANLGSPLDDDTRQNLRLVEAQVPTSVRGLRPAGWYGWWPSGLRAIRWKLWAVLALVFTAIALLTARGKDRSLAGGSILLAAALVAWTALAWAQARMPTFGVTAIAKVKSGPGATFSDITTLEPGSLLSVELTRDGWLKVRFLKPEAEEETVGWVEPAALLRIE